MGYGLPGFSVGGTSQTKILERIAISFSRVSSQLRDWTHASYIVKWIHYHRALKMMWKIKEFW